MVLNNNNNNNNNSNINSVNQQLNENINLNAKLANMLKLSMNNTTIGSAVATTNNLKPILPSAMGSLNNKQLEESGLSAIGNNVNGVVSTSGNGGKILSNEDKKINLNALKNQDPFATNIIDTALRVAVYKFVSKKNEWVRHFLFFLLFNGRSEPKFFVFKFFRI